MKKRVLAVLLALALAICVFPVSAFADYYNNNEASITGTYNAPYGATSGGDTYYVKFEDKSYWVGWAYTPNHIAIRVAQAYLYKDGQYAVYNNVYGPITVSVSSCVDGYFGNITEQTIRLYQSAHGLTSDGAVGKNTWRNMANGYGTTISGLLPYSDSFTH